MIGLLEGKIVYQDGQQTIILTSSGVGYELKFNKMFAQDSIVRVFVSHIVREDSEQLYGFGDIEEKNLFEQLLQVNGVGPKSAYALVSGLGVAKIHQAILMEDAKTLKSVPGIGPKTVVQIILLLKDKLLKGGPIRKSASTATVATGEMTEALMAFRELGYKDDDVIPLLKKSFTVDKSPEELIRTVLQELR